MDAIEKAHKHDVNLLITHHDAWDFIYGLKEACTEKLREYRISHYYVHLPLDDSEFGTNSSLLKVLGLNEISKQCLEDGFYSGAIGEYDEPISFKEFCSRVEVLLREPVTAWRFNNKPVKRVLSVCGAGFLTSDVKVAVENDCDVYITGEKILYTVQYAKHVNMNLLVGSHTFTELFGV